MQEQLLHQEFYMLLLALLCRCRCRCRCRYWSKEKRDEQKCERHRLPVQGFLAKRGNLRPPTCRFRSHGAVWALEYHEMKFSALPGFPYEEGLDVEWVRANISEFVLCQAECDDAAIWI